MAVDSKDGLRVRKEPSLNSSKICTLPDNFNVVVACLGPLVTIDKIKSAWVEILLPKYLWSGSEAEFGWVFGGYLKDMVNHQDYFPFAGQDFYDDPMEAYSSIPYKSPHLYDVIGGYSVYDRYQLEQENIKSERFPWQEAEKRKDAYEHERKLSLELLKLSYAGVVPYNPMGWPAYDACFCYFWDLVQENRQIYPTKNKKEEYSFYEHSGTHIDKSVSFDLQKLTLVYTNPDTKKSYTAEIPSGYKKDFMKKSVEELQLYSLQEDIPGMTEPFIRMKKKVYENEYIYHYEVFYYHIIGGKLIKFLQIVTCPELMDGYGWHFSSGGEDSSLIVDSCGGVHTPPLWGEIRGM